MEHCILTLKMQMSICHPGWCGARLFILTIGLFGISRLFVEITPSVISDLIPFSWTQLCEIHLHGCFMILTTAWPRPTLAAVSLSYEVFSKPPTQFSQNHKQVFLSAFIFHCKLTVVTTTGLNLFEEASLLIWGGGVEGPESSRMPKGCHSLGQSAGRESSSPAPDRSSIPEAFSMAKPITALSTKDVRAC